MMMLLDFCFVLNPVPLPAHFIRVLLVYFSKAPKQGAEPNLHFSDAFIPPLSFPDVILDVGAPTSCHGLQRIGG